VLALEKPLKRGNFLAIGVALFAAKIVLDAVVAAAFARPFSLAFYIDPFASLHPPEGGGTHYTITADHAQPAASYFLTVIGVALPFLVAGVAIVIRRLRDAGLPPRPRALFLRSALEVPLLRGSRGRAVKADRAGRP
jgi:hypothetical protein